MGNLIQQDIPGLGIVMLRPLSYGIMSVAYERAAQAKENERPIVFANLVLSWMLEQPSWTPEDIDNLPDSVIAILVDIAVDMWGIRADFDSSPASLSPQVRLYQAYFESSERFNKAFQRQVSSVPEIYERFEREQYAFRETIEAFSRACEKANQASPVIGPSLTQAGFWLPPSAPMDLSHSVKTLVDKGEDTANNVRQAIAGYYRENDFCHLSDMISDWHNNPYFADRMPIIFDALEAHRHGKYTLSIPALLPLVEGILIELVGPRDKGYGVWVEDAIADWYSSAMHEAYKDATIEYVTGIKVYGRVDPAYFTPQRYPEWLNLQGLEGNQVLQRHAILHGVQTDYASEENSLRAFFLLDVVSWMKRKEWDEVFKRHVEG